MSISFHPIARLLTLAFHPAHRVDLSAVEDFLSRMVKPDFNQGVLITVNHYSSLDFHAWWFVILVSAYFPVNIHWVITSGWTNSGWLTGFTHWLFPLAARILGFTPMPAMPPDPRETDQRAASILHVLNYADKTPQPVIGMAPEGGDSPGGVLARLHPGVGRFMLLLSKPCPYVLPVGVWKDEGHIQLKFGSPYQLEVPQELSKHQRDRLVGNIIMHQIALCLPERLRGEYGTIQNNTKYKKDIG